MEEKKRPLTRPLFAFVSLSFRESYCSTTVGTAVDGAVRNRISTQLLDE